MRLNLQKFPKTNFSALQRLCGSREIQPTMRNGARADFLKNTNLTSREQPARTAINQKRFRCISAALLIIILWLTICRVQRLCIMRWIFHRNVMRYDTELICRPLSGRHFSIYTVACATTSKRWNMSVIRRALLIHPIRLPSQLTVRYTTHCLCVHVNDCCYVFKTSQQHSSR
jgi:tRNA uridine 5-carbamoylmethylation protein Kti12